MGRQWDLTAGLGTAIPYWQDGSFEFIYNPRTIATSGFDTANADVDLQFKKNLILLEAGVRFRLGRERNYRNGSWFIPLSVERTRWRIDYHGTSRYHTGGERSFASGGTVDQYGLRLGIGRTFAFKRKRIEASATIRAKTWDYGWYSSGRSSDWLDMPMVDLSYVFHGKRSTH